ncbi:probable LRR receptor-like serine/threonine-protein kinase At3g47570 [Impatiens glandulifera]|uniref:probable LRR receptor-like serine/threonine-protein kinase At3g47570 n=1 Tax=Impatiens glandulifera TaxID=253017 RepID=UPI001FB09B85|nr:probable LRR receptor-like serine/threonine-protein kinase At3g47570 [Impatiens glandulifera]
MVFSHCNEGFFMFLFLLLLLPYSLSVTDTTFLGQGNETDWLALLDFKNQITSDPLNKIMDSWNQSIHFCSWFGVTCSPSSGRVITLNLSSLSLVGTITPSLGNLTFLTQVNLGDNSFSGEIPQQIGRLQRLQSLNLSNNYLGGNIPTNLTTCRELKVLHLVSNELVGEIPNELSPLSKLLLLYLANNKLTGKIPTWIGNFSSLRSLSLSQNNFQGGIPQELGKLSKLKFFQLYGNELVGTIPSSIYNISTIYFFSVTKNQLHGELPQDIGLKFPNLQFFYGGGNRFKGQIPPSLRNSSALQALDFANNLISGTIPTGLGRLQNLYRLNFDNNKLGNGKAADLEFLASLANCSALQFLGLKGNMFGGSLPRSIANLSTNMQRLTLGSNLLSGTLPDGIGNLFNLYALGLENNSLNGSVPNDLGKLQNIVGLYLSNNRFSTLIPSSFGNLTALTGLFMEDNMLEGNIPPSLGNCTKLLELTLSRNNLGGSIPKEIMGLSSLSISLSLANNQLTGSIPFEVGKLINLKELHVSGNNLSGEIPSSLGGCIILETLLMDNNLFEGKIPPSIKDLKGLVQLDLSHNNLSGEIPRFLAEIRGLEILDLSYNDLQGEVPTGGIFNNASQITLLGNEHLCGGISNLLLPACPPKTAGSSRKTLTRKTIIIVVIVIVLFALLSSAIIFCIWKRTKKTPITTSSENELPKVRFISYQDLLRSTDGFSTSNLIGSGSFGSVYKGSLPNDGTVVAVKVLNLQQQGATKTFIDECKALKGIKHRNLLELLTVCSSVDYQGNDFKALVYEFMINGNLDQWLHPEDQNKKLNMKQRLAIAMDVAHALEYLHYHCETPIVHRDLKPSNVLLDQDMTAHVGDFGLASFVLEASNGQSISEGLKGSIGYIAPECGLRVQVSTFEDVYSYGILLLEMFTGKRPTDDMFKDGLDLHSFVAMALPENAMNIVDPSLLLEEAGVEEETYIDNRIERVLQERVMASRFQNRANNTHLMEESLIAVMSIGVSCSNSLPSQRMAMDVVTKKLHAIRDSFNKL